MEFLTSDLAKLTHYSNKVQIQGFSVCDSGYMSTCMCNYMFLRIRVEVRKGQVSCSILLHLIPMRQGITFESRARLAASHNAGAIDNHSHPCSASDCYVSARMQTQTLMIWQQALFIHLAISLAQGPLFFTSLWCCSKLVWDGAYQAGKMVYQCTNGARPSPCRL